MPKPGAPIITLDPASHLSRWYLLVPIFSFWLLLLVLLPGAAFIRDGDTFWHIRTGQWILDHLAVPTHDFYSYTFSGAQWIDGEWLAEIIIALAYGHGGWAGVALLTASLCALALTIQCWYLVSTIRFSAAIVWTLTTAFLISPHFIARPHIFSFVTLSVWLAALIKAWDRPKFEPPLLLLCPVMVLWANLHGSFLFGYVLFLVFCGCSFYGDFLTRDYRHAGKVAVTAVLTGCCALATPYGIKSAMLTFETLQLHYVLAHISEWRSPDFQAFWPHMLYLVGLLATMLAFGTTMRGPRVILFCILLILALSHVRGLFILYLAAPFLVACPIRDECRWLQYDVLGSQHGLTIRPALAPFFKFVQLLIPLLLLGIVVARWTALSAGPSQGLAPKYAVDILERNRGTDHVFNSYRFGGYLIFRGIPVFIDSRTPPYTDAFMKRTLQAANAVDLGDALKLLHEYKIQWVLLEPSEPLGNALALSPNWLTVFSDKDALLLRRSSAAGATPALEPH